MDISRYDVIKLNEEQPQHIEDEVVVEEPLEVRVNGQSISVTMRTPGNDFDLVAGLLWTDGIVESSSDIGTLAYCASEDDPELRNVVNVTLTRHSLKTSSLAQGRAREMRNSSCGLCGKATLAEIHRTCMSIDSSVTVDFGIMCMMPARLRAAQANFERTGGIHAAGIFDSSGNLLLLREDLGRHNAVDKALGAAFLSGRNLSSAILIVSGRLGFEIAQKALVAGIPIVASVSAPSSLAIELANDFGMTAVGFLRDRSMNVYSHPQRIIHGISKYSA